MSQEALSIDPNYQPVKTLLEAIDPTFKADPHNTKIDTQETTPNETDENTDSTPTVQPRYEAHYATGMAYLDAGKIDESISEFQNALDMEPDYVDAHLGLAKAYFQNQQLDEAENSVHEVLRLDPNSQDGKQLLDEIECLRKEGSDGEEVKETTVHQEDIDIDKELERGLVYLNQNQYYRAVETFKGVIQADPDNVVGHSRLGEAYLAWGGYDDAKVSAEKALELNPNHKPAQDTIQTIKYIQKIERNAGKRKKLLVYATIVFIVLAGLFIAYRYGFFGDGPPTPPNGPIPSYLSIKVSLINGIGNESNQVFAGQDYSLKIKIENSGGPANNLRLKISPNPDSINGVQFTIPNDQINIGKNKSDTINIKIISNSRAVTSRYNLNIRLVDSANKSVAKTVFPLRVIGPEP